ncbi:2-dehydro-3-deoxy-D-gluconate 5-dehydrogenase [Porphyridium purpureum]|uniref:2-dehydro-3-deoxy-D-gluconate 5-dehydrogenase n=1 Tax=Porphyridium purpureum TaxID=35688 RepID=A0A5J4YKK3_PORPP|nr:2-dehydro-3-deoxy-D-gluconate 5-dehydrogenase [Porphyridium purpureum]|eukprot:POR7100..scf244_11
MSASMFDLAGRVAIVTGGNGGIGLGIAEGLASAGATVVVAARDTDKSLSAVERLSRVSSARHSHVQVDVADEASCRAMSQSVVDAHGRIDILVANAGITVRKAPEDLTPGDWSKVLSVNLDGTFFAAQAVFPFMKQQGGGKVITVGSMASLFGLPFAAAYAAAKGGVVQLTRSLATAWAADNIQCNAILPGWIDTDLTSAARSQVEGLHERVVGRTPAGRWGRPDDFAGVAVFLASRASDFVTGTALPVDGGYSVNAG